MFDNHSFDWVYHVIVSVIIYNSNIPNIYSDTQGLQIVESNLEAMLPVLTKIL